MATERVTFTSEGLKLVGDLRVPDDSPFEADGKLPALTLTGPLSGVKDQVVGDYAALLVEEGFVTLAFDHRNFGDSEGEPRQHEDSAGKLADLRDAVGYLASRPEVDPDRIAVVGVCLGGGYAVRAGAFDPRVRAIAGVGGAYNSPHRLRGMLGTDGYRGLLAGAVENLERERTSGEMAYVPAVATDGPALMPGQEPFDYYGTERSTSAVWENRMTVDSRWQLLTLDALSAADLLDRTPFLVVHGTVDTYCTPEGAQAIFDRASTAEADRVDRDPEPHRHLRPPASSSSGGQARGEVPGRAARAAGGACRGLSAGVRRRPSSAGLAVRGYAATVVVTGYDSATRRASRRRQPRGAPGRPRPLRRGRLAHAELPHHPERVEALPLLRDLAALEAEDRDSRHLDSLPRGGHAHQIARVGAAARPADDDAVSLTDHVIDAHVEVGVPRAVRDDQLLEPLRSPNGVRHRRDVAGVVLGDHLVDHVERTEVPDLIPNPARTSLVVLD